MKADFIQAYNELAQIPVAGPAVDHMFMAKKLIEKGLEEMPDDPAPETHTDPAEEEPPAAEPEDGEV